MMKLRHIHLPPLTPYTLASSLQDSLRRTLLFAKDLPSLPAPPPYLISFTPPPTYTLGRRQTTPLSQSDVSRLTAPLTTPLGTFTPDLLASPRGGLTTYHGPGQVVLWPVVDIHSQSYRQFTVRSYACLLEKTTISVLRDLFGLEGFTTSDPGVWVRSSSSSSSSSADGKEGVERKVAAMGVHLRRHVTSLGTAVNMDFPWADKDEGTNPWARFVPCGLEGKEATSVAREVEGKATPPSADVAADGERLATEWAREFAERIGVGEVERVGQADIDGLVKRLSGIVES
jgi:lipoyl(octanoyl) transferase